MSNGGAGGGNTGGGGGGAGGWAGGYGGSGIVIVRYVTGVGGVDPDSDGDGLLDSVDPDDDNDGMSDADEAVAGTNPTNPLSVLRIVNSAFRAPSSEFVISWPSVSSKRYRVQAATNLLSGFTLNLRTNIFATPPENVHTDSVQGVGIRFYRVKVE